MLRDGRGAHGEVGGDGAGRQFAAPGEHLQDGPPGGVGQGGEAIDEEYYKEIA
jgi:hypothetical protein